MAIHPEIEVRGLARRLGLADAGGRLAAREHGLPHGDGEARVVVDGGGKDNVRSRRFSDRDPEVLRGY
jgi:hypothetical protein